MYETFEWPLPHAYELTPGDDFSGPEPALLTLARGHKVQGSLTRFLPAHGVVEFLPSRGRVNIEVPLADILELRLTRAVLLRERESVLNEMTGGAQSQSARQPYRIDLANGAVAEGETLGFCIHPAGLFLYAPSYGNTVIRSFFPQPAIRSRSIGKPIGQVLVESRAVNQSQVDAALARQRALREQKLGEILAELNVITREQLQQALERQSRMPMVRLGEALVQMGRITEAQLHEALALQKDNRGRQLGELLIQLGHISPEELFRALSQKLGIPAVDLGKFVPDPQALKEVPAALARELGIMPLCLDGSAIVVAMGNPLDPGPPERIRFVTQRTVRPVLASQEEIRNAIRQHYGTSIEEHRAEELASRLFAESAAEAPGEDNLVKETDSTLVKLVNKVIMDAHAAGASDIHIECHGGKKNVGIRFRRDGVLSEYLQVPYNFRSAIVSRLKIMASLDISERRRPQDGRIDFRQFGPANVELRMATVPTQDGLEDIVLRLLNRGEPLPLAKLGIRPALLGALNELVARSYGLLLVCGPTGSGKTTTLHSLLAVINSPQRKIWTAEDPVEITQPGLRQVQVNPRIGWSFAGALRAFLRSDPDVIMVGEMRDGETAAMGIEASLTGHLVFSTLHTNSAPETVVRLLEMGMDPFSFADSLAAVLAQRLARRLCEACRTSEPMSEEEREDFLREYCHGTPLDPGEVAVHLDRQYGRPLRSYAARGCEQCHGTGYKGRMGLHELLVVDADLRTLVQRRASAAELRTAAVRAGMRTLRQDGLEKCLAGWTDRQEVRAAT